MISLTSLIVYTCLLLYYHQESFHKVVTNVEVNNFRDEIWSDLTRDEPVYSLTEAMAQ